MENLTVRATKLKDTEKNLSRSSEEPIHRKICTYRTTVCNPRASSDSGHERSHAALLSSFSWLIKGRIELCLRFYNKMKDLFQCVYCSSVHFMSLFFVSPNFFLSFFCLWPHKKIHWLYILRLNIYLFVWSKVYALQGLKLNPCFGFFYEVLRQTTS